jgi:hypothetical protein
MRVRPSWRDGGRLSDMELGVVCCLLLDVLEFGIERRIRSSW